MKKQIIAKQKFIDDFVDALKPIYYKQEAIQILKALLFDVFNIEYYKIVANNSIELTENQLKEFNQIIKRLLQHEPYEYIVENAHFYGMDLYVNKNVLIPRPETEELVNLIVQDHHKEHHGLDILDIGTGSGCIALALANRFYPSNVWAIEKSKEAIAVAKKSDTFYQTKIHFKKGNIFYWKKMKLPKFDIIVSNPPYIPEAEKKLMHKNVLMYEPHTALFVKNENPLKFYNAIADLALVYLKPNGKLYFECNEFNANDVADMLLDKGFKNVSTNTDLQGKDRMVRAY
ncbi:MAG: peptide chain release factor N(5)-glutamine methyltransferase [Bacteroidetes bacterium]|nr:peptide chain release factor N(5)-glutamine methyltransferase [Bacteroidota bacterium]MCB9227020.1 peptide chain release factor N(5)-glutamine methyltransferase [Chitinophagales bacterium]